MLANALTSKDGLDALNGVRPRALVGGLTPQVAGTAAGQYGSRSAQERNVPAQRRAARKQLEIQAATTGYYQTQAAANTGLFDAGIRDGYESYKLPGSGAWGVRKKPGAIELPATIVQP